MLEQPRSSGGNRALLVQLDFGEPHLEARQNESALLAESAGVAVLAVVGGKRKAPDAALFAGKGKVAEIGERLQDLGADFVIFNHDLSPGQQRNLEKALACRVVDRSSLILDIFAQR